MRVRICPRCKHVMNEDEDGYWCSNEDECDYEVVVFKSITGKEE